jgi:transposase
MPRPWHSWSELAGEARVKGWAAHAIRRLVGARSQLIGISIDLSNQVRSTLKTFGLRATGGAVALTSRCDTGHVLATLRITWSHAKRSARGTQLGNTIRGYPAEFGLTAALT